MSIVAIGALFALLRPEYFDITTAVGAGSSPATLVEPVDSAAVSAIDSIDHARLKVGSSRVGEAGDRYIRCCSC